MGQVTSKDNKAKSKMKHPLDMPTLRFEHGGSELWSNTLPLDYGGTLHVNEASILVKMQWIKINFKIYIRWEMSQSESTRLEQFL